MISIYEYAECLRLYGLYQQLQGDPKQTDIFEMGSTLLWVNSGKNSN